MAAMIVVSAISTMIYHHVCMYERHFLVLTRVYVVYVLPNASNNVCI